MSAPSSVAADDIYDAANRAAHSEAGWSPSVSAIEMPSPPSRPPFAANRVSPMACFAVATSASASTRRSCGPAAMIIGLADSCATLEPALTDTAAEVREVVNLS